MKFVLQRLRASYYGTLPSLDLTRLMNACLIYDTGLRMRNTKHTVMNKVTRFSFTKLIILWGRSIFKMLYKKKSILTLKILWQKGSEYAILCHLVEHYKDAKNLYCKYYTIFFKHFIKNVISQNPLLISVFIVSSLCMLTFCSQDF